MSTLSKQAWMAVAALASAHAFAMTPGPLRIIQCPGSDALRQAPSLNSGNTFGASFWSDGFMVAPMLPDFPAITRCADDGPIFWVSSAKVVGTIAPWGPPASAPAAWTQAPATRQLRADEYLQAIAQGLGDSPDKLGYLRRHAWWAANQAVRSREAPGAPVSTSDFAEGSVARANLEALVGAFDESDADQLLTKAEALRELARFDEAERLLQSDKLAEPRMQPWVVLIKERVRLRDARVARVKTER